MFTSNKLVKSGFDSFNKQQLVSQLSEISQDNILRNQYPNAYKFIIKNIKDSIKRSNKIQPS